MPAWCGGGKRPSDPALARGLFFEPTVFADVLPSMRIAREEIFGPVLSVFRWSDEAAMLEDVNDVEYGLTASLWTNDLCTAHRTAAAVQAGYVWVNQTSSHFSWGRRSAASSNLGWEERRVSTR